jgi:ABC-type Zn uptake system ZnuABC Zn-binding protein ZnuA
VKKASISLILILLLAACQPRQSTKTSTGSETRVLAVESFLADITQNIAGTRLKIDSLIPLGMDPHTFEPTPADLGRISECRLLFINGAGLESWLTKILGNAGGQCKAVEASAGLQGRPVPTTDQANSQETDPHFFMDPIQVIKYVENIQQALSTMDPSGRSEYESNAQVYIQKLRDLDSWIATQVAQVPIEKRLIVTNHESLGYFADRYHFKVVGTILPSASSEAQPSAQQIASLIETIHQTGVKAIFLETGNNTALAQQIAQDAGITVVSDLYEHSLSDLSGPAPTYIDMMKYNTTAIVNALK